MCWLQLMNTLRAIESQCGPRGILLHWAQVSNQIFQIVFQRKTFAGPEPPTPPTPLSTVLNTLLSHSARSAVYQFVQLHLTETLFAIINTFAFNEYFRHFLHSINSSFMPTFIHSSFHSFVHSSMNFFKLRAN